MDHTGRISQIHAGGDSQLACVAQSSSIHLLLCGNPLGRIGQMCKSTALKQDTIFAPLGSYASRPTWSGVRAEVNEPSNEGCRSTAADEIMPCGDNCTVYRAEEDR